jgi:uncharacterized repeat protein (TIGR03943 family)
VRKDAQAVLLLLVGGTLLKISFTGTYVRYVKPGQLPLLVGAGVVLVAVAGATLWQTLRTPGAVEDGHAHEHHDVARVAWLLLIPSLALLLFAPPALGSFQASRSGTALSSQAGSDFAPLPDGDPVRVSVLDYASRAVFDKGRSLAGRRVTLSGFVIAGPTGQPYLARMIVTCCAADARPVKVGLTGQVPGDLKPDEWIEVVGGYTDRTDRDPVNQDVIPYLQVASAHAIPAPELQYES